MEERHNPIDPERLQTLLDQMTAQVNLQALISAKTEAVLAASQLQLIDHNVRIRETELAIVRLEEWREGEKQRRAIDYGASGMMAAVAGIIATVFGIRQ